MKDKHPKLFVCDLADDKTGLYRGEAYSKTTPVLLQIDSSFNYQDFSFTRSESIRDEHFGKKTKSVKWFNTYIHHVEVFFQDHEAHGSGVQQKGIEPGTLNRLKKFNTLLVRPN